ncbi:MAG TPA: hypothetical protein VFE51_26195 [Verrucomicrobiae bacterium]|nr:hypothetical protein [Verrucomicrobiae bacterium]
MKTAFFPAKLLQGLPSDNVEALAALCTEFERFDGHARQLPEHHGDYVEALSILRGFAIARETKLEAFPEIGPQRHQNIAQVAGYFTRLRDQVRGELSGRYSRGYFETKTEEYVALFSRVSVYEFSDGDFKRVHELVRELRDLIRGSSLISEEHKRRLLRRLEAMHAELHKKTSDIDRFWGFIGEAGIAMRKFGEDLAPISERVLELGGIVITVIFAKEGIKALPEVSQIVLPHS